MNGRIPSPRTWLVGLGSGFQEDRQAWYGNLGQSGETGHWFFSGPSVPESGSLMPRPYSPRSVPSG